MSFVSEICIHLKVGFHGGFLSWIIDDMLGGHVDDMEADMSKPIVSIRYFCT